MTIKVTLGTAHQRIESQLCGYVAVVVYVHKVHLVPYEKGKREPRDDCIKGCLETKVIIISTWKGNTILTLIYIYINSQFEKAGHHFKHRLNQLLFLSEIKWVYHHCSACRIFCRYIKVTPNPRFHHLPIFTARVKKYNDSPFTRGYRTKQKGSNQLK